MSFVKEVTYRDTQNSHWVAEVAGRHEWDAVNEEWIADRQIGWRSTNGLENFGKVTFSPIGTNQTNLDVYINYIPPVGFLGVLGEKLGAGSHFEQALQNDLSHFARMVDEAPAGALDPTSSNYLFHPDSAAAQGNTTQQQNETMYNDAIQSRQDEVNRPMMDRDITGTTSDDLVHHEADIDSVNPPIGKRETPGS